LKLNSQQSVEKQTLIAANPASLPRHQTRNQHRRISPEQHPVAGSVSRFSNQTWRWQNEWLAICRKMVRVIRLHHRF
jgi:hypothetical protein